MVSRITAWARLTMTSIDGVSAKIANAGLTISCRVGNCGKYGPAPAYLRT